MARYGYDYGSRYPDRGGRSGYAGYDVDMGGPRGWYGRWAGWSDYPEGAGWSAPEYGIYLSADYRRGGGFAGGGGVGYETDGWTGYEGGADSVRAGDIMTENPETVTPDTSLAEVAQRMRDLNVGIIPVVDDEESGRLRGVVTDRDIAVRAAAEGKDMKKTRVSEVMTGRVETVTENHHVRDVFDVMKREQVRRVPVVDREGRLVGIIAQADLAIDYAGLDLQRETEVEEVIERISEPGRPRWSRAGRRIPRGYDRDIGDRLRHGWRTLQREARDLFDRGYDRGWR